MTTWNVITDNTVLDNTECSGMYKFLALPADTLCMSLIFHLCYPLQFTSQHNQNKTTKNGCSLCKYISHDLLAALICAFRPIAFAIVFSTSIAFLWPVNWFFMVLIFILVIFKLILLLALHGKEHFNRVFQYLLWTLLCSIVRKTIPQINDMAYYTINSIDKSCWILSLSLALTLSPCFRRHL